MIAADFEAILQRACPGVRWRVEDPDLTRKSAPRSSYVIYAAVEINSLLWKSRYCIPKVDIELARATPESLAKVVAEDVVTHLLRKALFQYPAKLNDDVFLSGTNWESAS